MSNKSQNLRRGVGRIGGGIVERLNSLEPGLGSDLAREINRGFGNLNARLDAQAGHRGTVELKPQTRRDPLGRQRHSLKAGGGRIGDAGWAQEDNDLVPLSQARSFFTCENFGGRPGGFFQFLEECGDVAEEAAASGIMPYFFGWTVHAPSASDTYTSDGITAGEVNLYSFVLPAPAEVSKVTFYNDSVTIINPVTINIGLYDSDFNLVFQTGTQTFGVGTHIPGPNQVDLGQTYELPMGEYFEAYAQYNCMNVLTLVFNTPLATIMNNLDPNTAPFRICSTTSGVRGDLDMPESLADLISNNYSPNEIPVIFYEQ